MGLHNAIKCEPPDGTAEDCSNLPKVYVVSSYHCEEGASACKEKFIAIWFLPYRKWSSSTSQSPTVLFISRWETISEDNHV